MAVPAATTIVAIQNGRGVVRLRIARVAGATSYKVYRDTSINPTTLRTTVTPSVVADEYLADDVVTPGTVYFYRVKASNADGDSAYSVNEMIRAANYTATKPAPTNALLHARH